MSSRDAAAIGVQALGSAASLLAVLIVSRRFGMEAQGQFGLLKAWSDALVSLAMFGLPQMLLHLAYHGDTPLGCLRAYAERVACCVMVAALSLAAVAAFTPMPWLAWSLLAVPALVLHGLLRSLLLRAAGPLGYAWVTSAPALALCALVAIAGLNRLPQWGPALVVASLVSLAVAWAAADRAGLRRETLTGFQVPVRISLHAFVQNATASVQIALLLALLGLLGQSLVEIGEASFALVVLQFCAVVAGYIAPLIYDRVAQRREALRPSVSLTRLGFAVAMVFIAVVLFLPPTLSILLPQCSATLVAACQAMTVAGALLLVNRIAASTLQAFGAFAELTLQALIRLAASVVALPLLLGCLGLSAAPALAGAVGIAELLVAARLGSWVLGRL